MNSPSPHSPAQPHVVQRYGCAEYVGAVGAGCADGADMNDVVTLRNEGDEPSTHARERGGVEAELEYGFLDAVAPGFQCFRDAEPTFVVGYVVGDDVDHRQATPLHW